MHKATSNIPLIYGTKKRCPYYKTENKPMLNEFKFHIQDEIRDIEELVDYGRNSDTCPFYSTKEATNQAQVNSFNIVSFITI